MDRNTNFRSASLFGLVALRKESVDRNWQRASAATWARRVALRKESVDRNCWAARARVAQYWSLSARRAWIEINMWCNVGKSWACRSPQGERG